MLRLENSQLRALLLGLTVVAYLPLGNNDFVDFDDEFFITKNSQVRQGLTGPGFAWAWTTYHGNYWQPVAWLSLQLDAQFFWTEESDGQRVLLPAAFHIENLCWHGASVLLLFGLWHRLTGARWRSFLVAALFAVHPMHVESVAWAAERKDVLSVFFGILTLRAYVRYLEKPGWQRYLGMATAFLLSLLSKPMLMTLPFVLLLLDYWPLRRLLAEEPSPARTPVSFSRLVLEKVPVFVLAAGIGALTLVFRERAGSAIPLSVIPLSARVANALAAYGWYVLRTFCPLQLAVLYPHPQRHWSILSALAGAGVLLAITLLALGQARRRRWLITGWLWFVGTLVPVIGLTQGGVQAWADRFSYWPHLGLFVATVWGLAELAERWRLPARVCGATGALILGCLGVLTWIQVGYWRDTVTLWERALAVTQANDRAHANLGKYSLDRVRLDQAAFHFAEAVRIQPDPPDYHYFLGLAVLALGRAEEAAGHFQGALERAGNYSIVWNEGMLADCWQSLGMARLQQGKPEAALPCFRKALELQPESADALAGIGQVLLRAGKRSEAVQTFQAALRLNPSHAASWHGLGLAFLVQGHLDRAVEAFTNAVRFNSLLIHAHSDLGLALGRQGHWAQAVTHHQLAVQLEDAGEQLLEKMNGYAPAPDSIPQGVLFRCRLAFALNQLGNGLAADEVYGAALKQDPSWPGKFTARARKLATDPDVNLRDPRLAYELASQAAAGRRIANRTKG